MVFICEELVWRGTNAVLGGLKYALGNQRTLSTCSCQTVSGDNDSITRQVAISQHRNEPVGWRCCCIAFHRPSASEAGIAANTSVRFQWIVNNDENRNNGIDNYDNDSSNRCLMIFSYIGGRRREDEAGRTFAPVNLRFLGLGCHPRQPLDDAEAGECCTVLFFGPVQVIRQCLQARVSSLLLDRLTACPWLTLPCEEHMYLRPLPGEGQSTEQCLIMWTRHYDTLPASAHIYF